MAQYMLTKKDFKRCHVGGIIKTPQMMDLESFKNTLALLEQLEIEKIKEEKKKLEQKIKEPTKTINKLKI